MSFLFVLEKNNQEEGRFVSIKSDSLPPLLRPTLASTKLALNFVSLEVFGSCRRVDTVRDEPWTCFISGQAANNFQEQIFKGIRYFFLLLRFVIFLMC